MKADEPPHPPLDEEAAHLVISFASARADREAITLRTRISGGSVSICDVSTHVKDAISEGNFKRLALLAGASPLRSLFIRQSLGNREGGEGRPPQRTRAAQVISLATPTLSCGSMWVTLLYPFAVRRNCFRGKPNRHRATWMVIINIANNPLPWKLDTAWGGLRGCVPWMMSFPRGLT